jgi:hypothetical protein
MPDLAKQLAMLSLHLHVCEGLFSLAQHLLSQQMGTLHICLGGPKATKGEGRIPHLFFSELDGIPTTMRGML